MTTEQKLNLYKAGLVASLVSICGLLFYIMSSSNKQELRSIQKENTLGMIKGVVKTYDGQKFIEGAQVMINTDTIISTDKNGIFKIILPGGMRIKKETNSYELTISKEGFKTKTQYHIPNLSDAEVRLEKLE